MVLFSYTECNMDVVDIKLTEFVSLSEKPFIMFY